MSNNVHVDTTRSEKMSDVEQQRSPSAVDLRKKFHKVSKHKYDRANQYELRQRSDNSLQNALAPNFRSS